MSMIGAYSSDLFTNYNFKPDYNGVLIAPYIIGNLPTPKYSITDLLYDRTWIINAFDKTWVIDLYDKTWIVKEEEDDA